MGNVYKDYTNHTAEIQSFIDAGGNPVTVEIGETVSILIGQEEVVGTIVSNPPAGKQKVRNLYRDPVTGRMEVEFIDVPEE